MLIRSLPAAPCLLTSVLAAGCSLLAAAFPDSARAQGRVDAQYEVTLAGIPIGRGAWIVDIGDEQYSALASGKTTGLASVISTGEGNSSAQGRVVKGQLVPSLYTVSMSSNKRSEVLKIMLANGSVKDFSIEPEPPMQPERIPVTDAHKRNVLDPMTGSLLRVPGTGNPVSPEACSQGASVFDGRMRYDLKLDYRRMESVKVDKGYQGPVVVCGITFLPISGYVPDRAAIKYLKAQHGIEVWFAPVLGTRMLMPYRLSIPTPLGTGVMQATRFINTISAQAGTAAAVR